MTFVEVAKLADIPVPGVIAARVNDVAVAVVRTDDGSVYAVEDRCSHADVALSEGDVEDCTLECWLHGSRFDVRTGRPSGPPATMAVRTFRTTTTGEGDHTVVLVSTTEESV